MSTQTELVEKLRRMGREEPLLGLLATRFGGKESGGGLTPSGGMILRVEHAGGLDSLLDILPLELWVGFSDLVDGHYTVGVGEFPGAAQGRVEFMLWPDEDTTQMLRMASQEPSKRVELQEALEMMATAMRKGVKSPNVVVPYDTEEQKMEAYEDFAAQLPPTLMVCHHSPLDLIVHPWQQKRIGTRGRALVGNQRVTEYVKQAVAKWRSDNEVPERSDSEWALVARNIVQKGIQHIKQQADTGEEEPTFTMMKSEIFKSEREMKRDGDVLFSAILAELPVDMKCDIGFSNLHISLAMDHFRGELGQKAYSE